MRKAKGTIDQVFNKLHELEANLAEKMVEKGYPPEMGEWATGKVQAFRSDPWKQLKAAHDTEVCRQLSNDVDVGDLQAATTKLGESLQLLDTEWSDFLKADDARIKSLKDA